MDEEETRKVPGQRQPQTGSQFQAGCSPGPPLLHTGRFQPEVEELHLHPAAPPLVNRKPTSTQSYTQLQNKSLIRNFL